MDPLVDHFYEWPLTKHNLWMPPYLKKFMNAPSKVFCLIQRNATSHKFVMGPFVAYESPQNLTYGCPLNF